MISTLFSHLSPHIDDNNRIAGLKTLLKQTGSYSHFSEIFEKFGDIQGEKIATFVIFMYCPDSSYFVASDSYMDVKLGIAELCGLDVETDLEVITLSEPCVAAAVEYICFELRSWKMKKLIMLRETAANLEMLARSPVHVLQKGGAKNVSDAATKSVLLEMQADKLAEEIIKTTRSKDRLREVAALSNTSMEEMLKEVP